MAAPELAEAKGGEAWGDAKEEQGGGSNRDHDDGAGGAEQKETAERKDGDEEEEVGGGGGDDVARPPRSLGETKDGPWTELQEGAGGEAEAAEVLLAATMDGTTIMEGTLLQRTLATEAKEGASEGADSRGAEAETDVEAEAEAEAEAGASEGRLGWSAEQKGTPPASPVTPAVAAEAGGDPPPSSGKKRMPALGGAAARREEAKGEYDDEGQQDGEFEEVEDEEAEAYDEYEDEEFEDEEFEDEEFDEGVEDDYDLAETLGDTLNANTIPYGDSFASATVERNDEDGRGRQRQRQRQRQKGRGRCGVARLGNARAAVRVLRNPRRKDAEASDADRGRG